MGSPFSHKDEDLSKMSAGLITAKLSILKTSLGLLDLLRN